MEALEHNMMVQAGALSSAAEQAAAHREELTKMMEELHATIIHQTALHAKVEEVIEERPPVRVPPGFQGADLRVTPTKAPAAEDPWTAVAGRASEDPWANSTARARGAQALKPLRVDHEATADAGDAEPEDRLLRTQQ